MLVGLAGIGLNIGLNLVLTPPPPAGGLALGTALTALLTTTGLLYLLRRKLGHIDGKAIRPCGRGQGWEVLGERDGKSLWHTTPASVP